MNYSQAQSYLNSFVNFESQLHQLSTADFSLNHIQEFLKVAGNPAGNLKIIHVAGTKGKGSTCAFLASILQEAGYKVGLYTSPHLHKVNERIRILDKDNIRSKDNFAGAIRDDELAAVLTTLQPFADAFQKEGKLLTYFEVLTVMALHYFEKSQVDVVILETGLGGRLDATNVINSSVAVLTPVSLDHTKILGSTLSQIAAEKAGIIKNANQKVVIAPQDKEAMDVMIERCQEFGISPGIVSLDKYKDLKIGLKGQHQMVNAATAIEAVGILKIMGFKINDESVSNGLAHVHWPGRFELLRRNPDVIVDCAHNEASSKALAETLAREYPHRRVILVLGISQDKDARAICNNLKKSVAYIILTKASHPRAHSFTQAEGKNYFSDKSFEIIEDLPKALEKASKIAGSEDVIVITGSVFIVAEAIDYCLSF